MATKKRFLRKFKASPIFKILKVLGILALVALFFYILINLNIFYIQKITVSGISGEELKYINSDDVEDLTSDYIGKRFFEVNPDEIRSLLEDSMYFDYEIYVVKQFPDEIEISIQERIPKLKVVFDSNYFSSTSTTTDSNDNEDSTESESNTCVLIDSEKIILDTCNNWEKIEDSLIQCIFTLPIENDYQQGDKIFSTEISFITELNQKLSENSLEIAKYLVPLNDVVLVEFDDSTYAIFNTEKQLDRQISEFEYSKENAIMQGKSFKEIDLRFDKPVLRVDKGTEWVTE